MIEATSQFKLLSINDDAGYVNRNATLEHKQLNDNSGRSAVYQADSYDDDAGYASGHEINRGLKMHRRKA